MGYIGTGLSICVAVDNPTYTSIKLFVVIIKRVNVLKKLWVLILCLLSFDIYANIIESIQNRIFVADKVSVSKTRKRTVREKIEIQFGTIKDNIISYFKYQDYHNDIKIEQHDIEIIEQQNDSIVFSINDTYTIYIEENRNTKPSFTYYVKNTYGYPRIDFVKKPEFR